METLIIYSDLVKLKKYEVTTKVRGPSNAWKVSIPAFTNRIFQDFPYPSFPMFDFVFREIGFFLLFTIFEQEILIYFVHAPSQLHPYYWAFIRVFQFLSQYLDQEVSIKVLFHIFLVSWEGSAPPWLSPFQEIP